MIEKINISLCYSVSIVNFEHAIPSWKTAANEIQDNC